MEPNDPDIDGDTLLDAEDDQDNDDIPNFYEMYDEKAVAPQRRAQEPVQPLRSRPRFPDLPALRAALIPGQARQ